MRGFATIRPWHLRDLTLRFKGSPNTLNVYLALEVGGQTSHIHGIFHLNIDTLIYDTGLTAAECRQELDNLAETDLILYDPVESVVYVTKALRRAQGKNGTGKVGSSYTSKVTGIATTLIGSWVTRHYAKEYDGDLTESIAARAPHINYSYPDVDPPILYPPSRERGGCPLSVPLVSTGREGEREGGDNTNPNPHPNSVSSVLGLPEQNLPFTNSGH